MEVLRVGSVRSAPVPRGGRWRRRLIGLAWLAIWWTTLHVFAAPWRELGGVVDERLRWLAWSVLLQGLVVGYTVGRLARLALDGGPEHLELLRTLLVPAAAAAAVVLVLLSVLGPEDAVGVVSLALLAYWGGLDIGSAIVPMLEGRSPVARERLY